MTEPCKECDGTGMTECAYCGGDGQLKDDECPQCDGCGDYECMSCDGSGFELDDDE